MADADMDMETSSHFEDAFFVCGVPDCTFSVPLDDINQATPEDLALMNLNIEPSFVPTPDEVKVLHRLLGENITCPLHGRDYLGYSFQQIIEATVITGIAFSDDPSLEVCYETEIVPLGKEESIATVAGRLIGQLSPYPEWVKEYIPTASEKPVVNFFTSQVSESGPDGTVEVNGQTLTVFKVSTARPELVQFEGCIQLRYVIPAIDPPFIFRNPNSDPE